MTYFIFFTLFQGSPDRGTVLLSGFLTTEPNPTQAALWPAPPVRFQYRGRKRRKVNLMKKIKHWLSRKNLACEIKLLLDSSQVLGADHQLIKSMQKAFQIEDEPMRIEVIYLDTPERDYEFPA